MNEKTRMRERSKREGVERRAWARLNYEATDPYTGERVVVVNGVASYPDWDDEASSRAGEPGV